MEQSVTIAVGSSGRRSGRGRSRRATAAGSMKQFIIEHDSPLLSHPGGSYAEHITAAVSIENELGPVDTAVT